MRDTFWIDRSGGGMCGCLVCGVELRVRSRRYSMRRYICIWGGAVMRVPVQMLGLDGAGREGWALCRSSRVGVELAV